MDIRQDSRLKKQPAQRMRLPPHQDLASARQGICHVLFHLFNRGGLNERSNLHPSRKAVANLELSHPFGQALREGLVNARLHINAIGADAGLTSVSKLRGQGPLHGCIQVCVVEDDEGRIAPQFQRELLNGLG